MLMNRLPKDEWGSDHDKQSWVQNNRPKDHLRPKWSDFQVCRRYKEDVVSL